LVGLIGPVSLVFWVRMDERNEINQTSPGEVLTDRGIRRLIRYGSPACGTM